MGDVAQDLILEILLNLPVKSLIRFKSVSNLWKEVISSQEFAYLHYLKKRPSEDGYLVDIMAIVEQDEAGLLHPYRLTVDTKAICNPKEKPGLQLQQIYQPPHIRRLNCSQGKPFRCNREILLGPCWGLYCKLSSCGDKFALWNPATREAKVVPLPLATPTPFTNPDLSPLHLVGYGFGASSKNNGSPCDFKFVRCVYDSDVCMKILEVYNSSNKCWHSVEASVGPACGCTHYGILGVELNQVVHWYVSTLETNTSTFIFTFNLGDETCGTLDLPPQVLNDYFIPLTYSLSTIGNQYLSLVVVPEEMHMDHVDIWIMRQHSTWTKHTRVELKGQVPRVFGFWNNIDGGVVFGQDDRSEGYGFIPGNYIDGENLVLFVNDDVQQKLPLKEIGSLTVVNYAESLINLN